MNIISIIACSGIVSFFLEISLLHHKCYHCNRHTLYVWALGVVFYWTFTIELSMWLLTFLVISITCLQTAWGDHRKLLITVKTFKCSILQLVILSFDWSHQYLYIFLIIYFSSIRHSERYRVIVWNSGTPFRKLSAIYLNYDYYGSTYLAFLYLLLTIGFPCSNLSPENKIGKKR